MRLATDKEILRGIYKMYLDFVDEPGNGRVRHSDGQVKSTLDLDSGDLSSIHKSLKDIPTAILILRIFHYMNSKYSLYDKEGNTISNLFTKRNSKKADGDVYVVNIGMLSSVLAELEYEHQKFTKSTTLSWIAISISLLAFGVGVLRVIMLYNSQP